MTRYFVPCCLLKCRSIKLWSVRVNKVVVVVESAGKSFYVFYRSNDTLKDHPQSRCYSTLIGWCWIMHPIRVEQTAWHLLLSSRDPGRGCWSLRKLHFSKIIWGLALGFSMDLRLNAMRRSINLSVCLVSDLEAGRFKFLGENLLCSKSPRKTHQIPQKF